MAPNNVEESRELRNGASAVEERAAASENGVRSMTRRSVVLGTAGAAVLLGIGAMNTMPAQAQVRPPGGQDGRRLLSSCIRCEKCFEICPHDVIKPAKIEDGVLAMRTPVLDFSRDWCDWCQEENGGRPLCAQVCPTQALRLPDGATKDTQILGKAVLDEDLCLAYRLIGCRFCYDACPYEAMELDADNCPSVITDRCNGCGACESVCVSMQNASISGGATHRAIVIVPPENQ